MEKEKSKLYKSKNIKSVFTVILVMFLIVLACFLIYVALDQFLAKRYLNEKKDEILDNNSYEQVNIYNDYVDIYKSVN